MINIKQLHNIALTIFTIFNAVMLCPLQGTTQATVKPLFVTQPVQYDSDDPAIWINKRNPSNSLIIGTDKDKNGALYVFNMKGEIIPGKVVKNLKRPNNVDVAYGMILKGKEVDIAVATERLTSKLRVFSLPDMQAIDKGGIDVFEGEKGTDFRAPMGIALYKNPANNRIYAIVSRKAGPTDGTYLWEYQLKDNGQGSISGTLVRKFGNFSGKGEIESIAVDNELGYVYYSDETTGIRKYYADPAKGNKELALFGTTGFTKEREGISIYKIDDGTGYILVSDQQANKFRIFPREGIPGKPHQHPFIKTVSVAAKESDGSDVVNFPILPNFPNGLFVAMSNNKTFHLYRWEDIAGGTLKIQPPNSLLAGNKNTNKGNAPATTVASDQGNNKIIP